MRGKRLDLLGPNRMIHRKTVDQHHGAAGALVGQRQVNTGKCEGGHGGGQGLKDRRDFRLKSRPSPFHPFSPGSGLFNLVVSALLTFLICFLRKNTSCFCTARLWATTRRPGFDVSRRWHNRPWEIDPGKRVAVGAVLADQIERAFESRRASSRSPLVLATSQANSLHGWAAARLGPRSAICSRNSQSRFSIVRESSCGSWQGDRETGNTRSDLDVVGLRGQCLVQAFALLGPIAPHFPVTGVEIIHACPQRAQGCRIAAFLGERGHGWIAWHKPSRRRPAFRRPDGLLRGRGTVRPGGGRRRCPPGTAAGHCGSRVPIPSSPNRNGRAVGGPLPPEMQVQRRLVAIGIELQGLAGRLFRRGRVASADLGFGNEIEQSADSAIAALQRFSTRRVAGQSP